MRSLPIVLSSLITLTLGLFIGMELAAGPASDSAPALPDQGSGTGPGTPSTGLRSRTADAGSVATPSGRRSQDTPRVDQQAVDAALRRTSVPDLEPQVGQGVLHGVVVTVGGESGVVGLPGVTVVATLQKDGPSRGSSPGRGAPSNRSLEDVVREAAETWADREGRTLRVQTDAQGEFEIQGLVDEPYVVRAYLEGYMIESGTQSSQLVVRPGTECRFQATPVRFRTFDLRLPDGSQPETAQVDLVGAGRGNSDRLVWTPEEPALGFTEPSVRIRATSGALPRASFGVRVGRYNSEEVDLDLSTPSNEVQRIDLVETNGILGRVHVSGDPDRLAGFQSESKIALLKLRDVASFDPAEFNFEGNLWQNSDRLAEIQNDEFAFVDLEPGFYGVGVQADGELASSAVVEVVAGLVNCELAVELTAGPSGLVVTVLGPHGQRLSGCSFQSKVSRGGGYSSRGARARRTLDGRDEIPFAQLCDFDFRDWPAGLSVSLNVLHSEFGQQWIELSPGQHELTLQFEQPASVLVRVPGAERSGLLSQLSVQVERRTSDGRFESVDTSGGDWRRSEERLKADETMSFEALVPGDYRFTVTHHREQWRTVPLVSDEVSIGPGPSEWTLPMGPVSSLIVRVPEAAEGAEVDLQGVLGGPEDERTVYLQAPVGVDGLAAFEVVPPGHYAVTVPGVAGSMALTISGHMDVTFQPEGPDCYRVAISDDSGALFRSGLRAGDTIVQVGQIELSVESFYRARAALREGGATVTVLRDGQRLTISLDEFDPFGDPAKAGGTLIPANL